MKTFSKQTNQVLDAISRYEPVRSSELAKLLDTSLKSIYKHIGKLQSAGVVTKIGETPKVFYSLVKDSVDTTYSANDDPEEVFIENNYIYVSPSGELFWGVRGFKTWITKNNLDYAKEKSLYVSKLKEISIIKKNGLVSAKKTILSHKEKLYLDEVLFSDFYNFDYFGKTKLGQLVYLGKSSQSKEIVLQIINIIKPSLDYIIKKYDIKYVCYIPPTIDRKIQFTDILKNGLQLDLELIKISKIPKEVKIPQKTLRKLEDRIENASKTIRLDPTQKINGNVLIIDDATGSGATLNETAKKIRTVAKKDIKIIGYSVVGSYKGFEVISEV